ncbi:hypothetical protein CHARACLAT_033171 [Characodon lateralis]|uniref:Uncharacterized protein n=1 Tax=Characodon lateralis TaxID=208331 RepID=A0ABU7E5M5_9TELE|nr:hypothetical protein [Characodon lateralis]
MGTGGGVQGGLDPPGRWLMSLEILGGFFKNPPGASVIRAKWNIGGWTGCVYAGKEYREKRTASWSLIRVLLRIRNTCHTLETPTSAAPGGGRWLAGEAELQTNPSLHNDLQRFQRSPQNRASLLYQLVELF